MSHDQTPPEETRYGRCEAYARSAGRRCGRAAIGEHGKCGYHGGKTDDAGAPEKNTNARTTGLHMREEDYIERQSDEDQEWIRDLHGSLIDMWRRRHEDKPPMAIRNRLESIAIDIHKVSHANAYMADEGLTQIRQEVVGDETINSEKLTLWSSETRHYNDSIERRLDKYGLLDPPEDRGGGGPRVYESDDYVIEVGEDVDFSDPDRAEKFETTFEDASSDPDPDDEPDE